MEARAARILSEVLERVQRVPDRRDLLLELADAIRELLPCDATALWMRSARHRPLKVRTWSPQDRSPENRSAELAAANVETCAPLMHGRCLRLSPVGVAPELAPIRAAMRADHKEDVLLVPFVHRGHLEGLASCLLHETSSTQVETWERIAPHVATVLHAARLHEASTTMRAYRVHFATLGVEILQASDVEGAAVRLCELTRMVFATSRSALFLLEGEDLVPIAAAGPYGERALGGSLHVPPGIEPGFDEVLRTRQVLVINQFRASPYATTPISLPFRPQAALVMPLVDGAGALGVLTASELDDPERFGPNAASHGLFLGSFATVVMRRTLLAEELRRAGRAKDDFLATVSHELRTPINVVLGYVQLLGEQAFGPLSSEQAATLRRVDESARSLLALVDDLLDLARIGRGEITCELGAVSLQDLADELGDTVRALIGGRPIEYSSSVPPGLVAWSDRARLSQVLLNVLTNAVKFTTRGSIVLRAVADGDRVVCEVADTGSGMEPGFVGRATEPFVRGEDSSGSGLGLAIVARTLRLLNGSLSIDSRPGKGTTVCIRLPSASAAR